jgi:UDP-N-acetylglucosamine acyltransferase
MEIETQIGNNNFFMKHSHVGHDVVLWNDCIISCGVKIGGHCIIENKVNIGLNASIHQRQTIAEGCMIGMSSVITKKLITQPFCKYAGNPAKYIGKNESSHRIA